MADSGGNSSCSPSRAFSAVLGGSLLPTPFVDPALPVLDLAESEPLPLAFDCRSGNSSDFEDPSSAPPAILSSDLPEVFKAAHHFAQQANIDVVAERKKNQDLMDFITAQGFSLLDVTSFTQHGIPPRSVNDFNIIAPSAPQVIGNGPLNIDMDQCSPAPKCPPVVSGLQAGSGGQAFASPSIPASNANLTLPQVKSWSSVVSSDSALSPFHLDFLPPPSNPLDVDKVIIRPPPDFLREGNRRWNSSLVGCFLTSSLPFKLVDSLAHKFWDQYGLQKVFIHGNGQFIFQFSKADSRDTVLALGPWYFANKLIILKPWKEGIDMHSESCLKAPVWVKLYNIPLSYWSAKGLSFIASGLGKPILADSLTQKLEPLPFARLCVEMTASSSFPSLIEVLTLDDELNVERMVPIRVEYQNKPPVCSHCHSFGHSKLRCPNANFQWVPKGASAAVANLSTDSPPTVPSDSFTAGILAPAPASPAPGPDSDPRLLPEVDSSSARFLPDLASSPALGSDPSSSDDLLSPSPSPNPLVRKLKHIDELSARAVLTHQEEGFQTAKKKKKKKGGGYGLSPS